MEALENNAKLEKYLNFHIKKTDDMYSKIDHELHK